MACCCEVSCFSSSLYGVWLAGGLDGTVCLSRYCSERNFQISPRCCLGTPGRKRQRQIKWGWMGLVVVGQYKDHTNYSGMWQLTEADRGRHDSKPFITVYALYANPRVMGGWYEQHQVKMSCISGIWLGHQQLSSTVKILDISKVITLTVWQIDVGVGRNKKSKKWKWVKKWIHDKYDNQLVWLIQKNLINKVVIQTRPCINTFISTVHHSQHKTTLKKNLWEKMEKIRSLTKWIIQVMQ